MFASQAKKIFSVRSTAAFLMTLSVLAGMPAASLAQTASPTPDDTAAKRGTWTAELPGGKYIVMLSAITSISQHEYVVDGAARVTEVNINTFGTMKARFYFIGPNTPQAPGGIGQSAIDLLEEKTTEAMGRVTGDDVWEKVMKSYPVTTHAGTIEYRIGSLETLEKLFKSVERSWLGRKAGKFKP
jgi:hypothetical protein